MVTRSLGSVGVYGRERRNNNTRASLTKFFAIAWGTARYWDIATSKERVRAGILH